NHDQYGGGWRQCASHQQHAMIWNALPRRNAPPFGLDVLADRPHPGFLRGPKGPADRRRTNSRPASRGSPLRRGGIENKRDGKFRPEGRAGRHQMGTRTAAIGRGKGRHHLLAMPRAVFHQSAARIAAGEAPSLSKISHAVMNIDVRSCEFSQIALETEHRRRFGPDLHQANLAHAANRAWIVAALDRRDGVGYVGRQAIFLGFPLDERAIGLSGGRLYWV